MAIELQTGKPFAAPTVEWLAVRLVVDSYYDRFIADATHPAVRIEHTRHIRGHERSTLAGEWGLSLHLESRSAGKTARYLLDFGYTPEILNRNFGLLDLDAGALDGLILSHGHLDHYGGLLGFVAHHRTQMRADLKLFAGGEANFDEKWIKRKEGGVVSWGRLDRAALEGARVETVCCDAAHALAGPFTTGQIGRGSFERVLENTLVAPAGAEPSDHFTEAELAGRLVPDRH
ncbi:MAG TPA: MBL fold metallo-hydrolase, partial [Stellaceae bacterium]|nr:MBL fold metallo-hydrolase [Stellaceae bacterium]